MTELQIKEAFGELVARGLIAAEPCPIPLPPGNGDRNESLARHSWRVTLPSGQSAKVTLGKNLSVLATRHAEFSNACPGLATTQSFYFHLPQSDALAESFFEGISLEQALTGTSLAPNAITAALSQIDRLLTATELASTEAARAREWQDWGSRLVDLPIWEPTEITTLRQLLLPALYQRLTQTAPCTTRWSNGDFLPSNILLDAKGEVRLIDTEFAARTHFFAEDAVRFRVLSSACFDRPDLDSLLPSVPDLAWHIYFWLRQFQLETENNTESYLTRHKVARLGLIRSLAEKVLSLTMTNWSVPALQADFKLEDLRWSQESSQQALMNGWCRAPRGFHLRGITAASPDGSILAAVPMTERRDVQQHFHDDPEALYSGFALQLAAPALNRAVTLCARLDQGTLLPLASIGAGDMPRTVNWDDYPEWATLHDPDPESPARTESPPGPLFSILLPVYRTPGPFLDACLRSVLAQHYSRWELCVVDDGSDAPAITECLHQFAAADARIRIKTLRSNVGISRATNEALAMTKGEFLVLLDHDDLLRPHCLSCFAEHLSRHPDRDALYSDEDKITAEGRRIIPFFKPAFSPEFLRGVMYVGHALCVRTSLARSLNGFDPAYDGVQDFEFLLRLSERTSRISHIPSILYHWRQSATSSALHGNVKGDMDERQCAAVQAHLQRSGDTRQAVALGGHRIKLTAPDTPSFELIHANAGAKPVAVLLQAAHDHSADVLVLSYEADLPLPAASLSDLVTLAARADSACVVPVLLAGDGRVLESGRTWRQPVMQNFHAESDGYNGTLRCNREVDHVSPRFVAIKRSLILKLNGSAQSTWLQFCQELQSRGWFHRVCATARLPLKVADPEGEPAAENAATPLAYFNPHLDPNKGDYSLAAPPDSRAPTQNTVRFAIDQPVDWHLPSGCLILRGWCFASGAPPIRAVRLRAGTIVLSGVIGMPRPDVRASLAEAPDDNTGFEIRGTLPVGNQTIVIEAQLNDGSWHELFSRTVQVKRQILPLWLGVGTWMELMFFQMPAHMAYPARPITLEKFPATRALPQPVFSIVTPSYNHARFLPETMRSVLDQAGVQCDYVVQDGGSSDGSQALLERLAAEQAVRSKEHELRRSETQATSPAPCPVPPASRLISWSSEPDGGQADAIVKGFAKTSGGADDVMAWINSDDFYLPGALEFVADYFARHPDVDVVYGHRIVVNEESQEIARWFLPKHDPEVLRLNDFVPQETLFWRRRIWDKVGGLDSSFKFAMDWDLLLRFQAAGAKIVRVPYFLACFRVHAAQKTSAQMHSVGQEEITRLRERTHGRPFPPTELETHPRLLRYLRRSAFIEFLWKLGIRAR